MTAWEDAREVLEAAYRVTTRQDFWPYASRRAINEELGRDPEDPRIGRVLYDLSRTGWLESKGETDQHVGPVEVELTERSLSLVAGWPSAESAASALIAAVAARRDAVESPEERGRLERLHQSLSSLSLQTLANLLGNVLSGQIQS